MARKETLTTATNRYLRESRDWLPSHHPLAVALRKTAEVLDTEKYSAAVMSQYAKLLAQSDALKPPSGQGSLPGTEPARPAGFELIGPARVG